MNYYSLNKKAPNTTFKNAVVKGLAPDKGLYFPESITPLPTDFFKNIDNLSYTEIAFTAIKQFVSPEIPEDVLKTIVEETLSFDFPVVQLDKNISTLELFHGPTMAFKDVGARFMARCLGYFNKDNTNEVTVLVATSGDTGGAVANGFLGVKGVNVVILYPSGKVSDIQEKQLTTLGENISALEVDGVFDDCQDMVKRAFLDEELTSKMQLTSANSINVARWLPQLFYFMFAYKQLHKTHKKIVFSVPSGNFGNICAGMVAQKLGLPIYHFIASNNQNNVVTNYLETEDYNPKPSVQTISNAMDVGNPSNFVRIQELHKNDFSALKENLSSFSFTDEETKNALATIYKEHNYVADPHGAVGYLGCKAYLNNNDDTHCVFLETAHPTKFLDVVEEVIKEKQPLPPQIQSVMHKTKVATKIDSYNELKSYLLKNN
ncbi:MULTISPECIES: threonine synthase [unclassified Cellulophaga]|uniref:threonine synthase n=1 Tax=unclassified Cellulophaga TaxID=2634405 RepID=UPI0026E4692A|nr:MULTISPECIES: threonine synthase [unclassified Cellulophaga]MDO6491991.1 threonine synthase [Cellulophaga sp. 2_MG-2023]MDO6495849.1 threonine synthase [Cellulophaga sp. 3_MG-2023]